MTPLSSIQNCYDKNSQLDTADLEERRWDKVENIYFDSDSGKYSPGTPVEERQQGPYSHVDSLDRVTVRNGEVLQTVTAKEFVGGDQFNHLGTPSERLGLVQKASRYEIVRGDGSHPKAQPVDPELQSYADSLESEGSERNMQSLKAFVQEPSSSDSASPDLSFRGVWFYMTQKKPAGELKAH